MKGLTAGFLFLGSVLVASPASSTQILDYGWEDGGTVEKLVGSTTTATNVTSEFHTGIRSLEVNLDAAGQAWLAVIGDLQDGDLVYASFYGMQGNVQLWGRYVDDLTAPYVDGGDASGDPFNVGAGGWTFVEDEWSFLSAGGTHLGLAIIARPAGGGGATQGWVDDLHIEYPDHAYVVPDPLPEPSIIGFLGLALTGLSVRRRRCQIR